MDRQRHVPGRWSNRGKKKFHRPRLSLRSLVCLLVGLALVPIILFHATFNRENVTDCEWIRNPPLICAHGGDSRAPPNTLAAYRLALLAGFDCIELDASLTRDGVLVTLHERELRAMSQSTGLHIGELSFEQLQELDAGFGFPEEFRGEKVPSLHSALKYVSRHVKQVIVDVKVGPPRSHHNLAAEVQSVVNSTFCKTCVVWSKVDYVVHDYKRLQPHALAGYIVMTDIGNPEMLKPTRIKSAEIVGIFHGLVNKQLVSKIQRAGKKVYAWTVNDEEDMHRIPQMSVDCIITNHPGQLQLVLERLRTNCLEKQKTFM